jgi:hypothetical protein
MPAWPCKNSLVIAVLLTLDFGGLPPSSAQQTVTPSKARVHVPFVGCKSAGQAGLVDAPTGPEKVIQIAPKPTRKLAYYKSGVSPGVLAPLGWSCFGIYGSGGAETFVAPGTIDSDAVFAGKWEHLTGPAVEVDFRNGGTSGRDSVARVIARVFPKYRAFVQGVLELFDGVYPEVAYGPYPTDNLVYKGDRLVEFRTPPNSEGLGTMTSRLEPNEQPIQGVATLVGEMPEVSLLLLTVRLPPEMNELKPAIIQQLERQAATSERRN